jgi:hypothetical protein
MHGQVASQAKRSSCIRVPYFGAALQCLPGTELVLTVTRGMSSVVIGNRITHCESTQRIASVSFSDGLASKTQQRSASRVATRSTAINNYDCQRVIQWGRRFPSDRSISSRWVLARNLPTRAGTELSATHTAMHNNVAYDVLPMTCNAVSAVDHRRVEASAV